ncbi:hypothetical protein GA0074692_4464 [Micromonospora pallida]|uniref:DUF2637 domain-containing protein n=1 Tax=Micromonospora pallida TaxID=145854 RepID=A0A1C6T4X1_9ACTN|nr:hypothetical protein [Micromonospora pallida]SCL36838.1 hypothetical protein GA0074692_4464 [Micromonospora pallida]
MPAKTPTAGTRIEGVVLVLILLTVAGFAGAASFTHVKDWTLDNSPAGTGEWFGWANAVISELVPVAALLTIRRRKRLGASVGYPILLLIASACLSLAAQLAVAKPGPSGWLLSAVPALAFMALVKLVLSPTPADTRSVEPVKPTEPIRVQVAEPAAESAPAITPAPEPTNDPTEPIVTTDPDPVPVAAADPIPTPTVTPAAEPVVVPTHLLPTARFAAVQHEQATGQPITAPELAVRLNLTPPVASALLDAITDKGTPVGAR